LCMRRVVKVKTEADDLSRRFQTSRVELRLGIDHLGPAIVVYPVDRNPVDVFSARADHIFRREHRNDHEQSQTKHDHPLHNHPS